MFGQWISTIASKLLIFSVVILAVLLICSSELASGNLPPSFIELPSYIILNESSEVDSTILQLKAMDIDDPVVTFTIQLVTDNNNNSINDLVSLRTTGRMSADLVLLKKLNSSVSPQYRVILSATDGTTKPIEKILTIYVASFKPPSIDNLPKTIVVAEDIAVGTQVYQVQARDTSSAVTFELQNGSDGSFSIEEMTGIVRNIKKLDYHQQRSHLVNVVVSNKRNLKASDTLIVNVSNTKSRPPYFLQSFFQVNIPENLPQGSSVYQLQAYDGNTDLVNDISYKIVAGQQNIFAINPLTGLVTTSSLIDCSLSSIKTSTSCSFNLGVEACQRPLKTEGSSCSTVLLVVSVDDVNNHAPTFSLPSYDCFIYKYAPPKTPIGCNQTISVFDDDLGENARFNLSLQPNNVSDWLMIQGPPDSTNLVFLIKSNSRLVAESSNMISFKVTASELSTAERLSSSSTINLHIINNNNNINSNNNNGCIEIDSSLRFTSEEYQVVINKLPAPGVSLATVKVAPASEVTYILRGPYKNIFSINEKTGDVTLARPDLINSTKGVYAFPVTAASGPIPQGLAFSVVVVHFDLQAPSRAVKMTFDNYVALLEENSRVFNMPVIIKAQQTDCKSNARISYYLIGNSEFHKNFTIDQTSGELKPQSPLDYEALPPYYQGVITLTVLANSSSDGYMGSTATVTVFLKDMNDNDPQFLQTSYNFNPMEPLKRGLLGSVSAMDGDATRPNNQIIYSFNSSSSSSPLIDGDFSIDPIIGSIYYLSSSSSSSSPSAPTPRAQTLIVMATDLGTPSRSSTVTVTVQYVPGSVSPSVTSAQVSCDMKDHVMSAEVGWSSKVDAVVLNVSESIRRLSGAGYRCHLTNTHLYDGLYRYVEKPQGLELFSLASDCSTIKVGISLRDNYRQVRTILSTLSVTNDSSNNQVVSSQRYDVATLIFFINPYTFSLDRPIFLPKGVDIRPSVSSSTPDGTAIARVTAVDPLEMDRSIRFSLSSRDPSFPPSFRINETTGDLFFTRNGLDFLAERSAVLTVTASSGNPAAVLSAGVASAETTVEVQLLPCTRPSFKSEPMVVGARRIGERIKSPLLDLKEFTDGWNKNAVYVVAEAMTTVDVTTGTARRYGWKTRDFFDVDERGLLTFKGSTDPVLTGLGSQGRLEVEVNVSSPGCGISSSATIMVFLIPDDGFVEIVVSQSQESLEGNYKNLTNRLEGISGVGIFPYAIFRIQNESSRSYLIVYCVDMATKQLLTYPHLSSIFSRVNEGMMNEFKSKYQVVSIKQYSGNNTMFPMSSSSSPQTSSSSSECLPAVIVLSVMCFIFFVVLVVLVVVYILNLRKRRKKMAKDVAVSYSNAMAAEYFGTNKSRGDEDKDSSTATQSSTTSDFQTTTSNASSSAATQQNFILRKPPSDEHLLATATPPSRVLQGDQGCPYDLVINDSTSSPADTPAFNSATNLVVNRSSVSLAASKFSDSALGSTDFSTARTNHCPTRAADDSPYEAPVLYSTVKKPSVTVSPELELGASGASFPNQLATRATGEAKSLPSYEQFRSGSVLRLDDNNAGDSFYI